MRKTANGTGRHIRLLIRKALDLFFPRYCPVCYSLLAETEIGVCPRCMVRMPRYIEGIQYGLDRLNGDVYIDALYSLFIFKEDGGVRPMIHALKYGGYSEIGEMLGRMAGRSYPSLSKDYDLIVPVPLHPRKQRKRGYNQALLIAQGLSRVTGIPVQEGLRRKVYTDSQTGQSYSERKSAMKGKFALSPNTRVAGIRILLVDDVLTTGATVQAAAEPLAKASVAKIGVLVAAVTKRPSNWSHYSDER